MPELTQYRMEDNVGGDTLDLKGIVEATDLSAAELQDIVDLQPGKSMTLDDGAVTITRLRPPKLSEPALQRLLNRATESIFDKYGRAQRHPVCVHTKTGEHYAILRVCLSKYDLTPLVVYHRRGVAFAREADDFLDAFSSLKDVPHGTSDTPLSVDIVRASGDCVCAKCNRPYREHLQDPEVLDNSNQPFLRILCDGTRVHL